ncbi:hypothetical protein CPC08DRAFT_717444 [Agrocybe pediades]|nr:hypothetical protein CPC08DRAFT_717444 [Agrocybe pediades]
MTSSFMLSSAVQGPLPPDNVSVFRRDAMNVLVVEVLFFGFYTCLFLVTMFVVWNSPPSVGVTAKDLEGKKSKVGQTYLLVTFYSLSALHVALSWWFSAHMYQINGASPLLVLDFLEDQPIFFIVVEGLVLAFITTIADSIWVWKCWNLFEKKLLVVIFPMLCIATSVVMAIVTLVDRIQFTFGLMHATVDTAKGIARWQHILIAYFAPSLASTVYTTGMIMYQLLEFRGELLKFKITRPSFSTTKVASVVVESALLYTISHIITVGLLVHVSPKFNFPQGILAQMAGISPSLLILRLHIGRYNEANRKITTIQLSGLDFAAGGGGSLAEEDHADSQSVA